MAWRMGVSSPRRGSRRGSWSSSASRSSARGVVPDCGSSPAPLTRLQHESRVKVRAESRGGPNCLAELMRLRLDVVAEDVGSLLLRVQLNQVSARVVEHGRRDRAHLCRFLCERDTKCRKALVLLFDVVDGKGGEGNSVMDKRGLEWFRGRVLVGLEYKLGPFRIVGRYDGEPTMLAEWDLGLLLETQDVGVEAERLLLVVDEDACQFDTHSTSSNAV